MKLQSIRVEKLFGYMDHELNLRADEPTIVLAPNGAGKTHMLRLTAALLALDATTLLGTTYSTFELVFSDRRALSVNRFVLDKLHGQAVIELQAWRRGMKVGEPLSVSALDVGDLSDLLPPEIQRVGSNRWRNERLGRYLTTEEIEARYNVRVDPLIREVPNHPEIAALCGGPKPVFIDTWRLDSRADSSGLPGEWSRGSSNPRRSVAASRIRLYTERLRTEITEARRASIQATQSADLSFAARALAGAKLTVKEEALHERYNRSAEKYEALARNGLAVGEEPIPYPDETTPTVRRILSLFLDDWEKRLEPLVPVNEKLQTLREILDNKLAPSGKRTAISARGELEFYSFSGKRLPVARLSSGEQHLVALFTLLLFAAQPGSLVLIDEPEISLHAAWKHAFLEDITRVAGLGDLQVVLATHSAGIVNGRWDLAEELSLVPSDLGAVPEDFNEDDDDDVND